jgi:tetratricopeptide (TPR) repeat protein
MVGVRLLLLSALVVPSCSSLSWADDAVDVRMAERYLRQAQSGDAKAQAYLGALYARGIGISQSDAESFRWFLAAAERGHAQARLIVGEMYAIGQGTRKNYIEAYKWAAAAATDTVPAETRRPAQQFLDQLAGKMNASDISEGRRLSQSVAPTVGQIASAPAPVPKPAETAVSPAPVSKPAETAIAPAPAPKPVETAVAPAPVPKLPEAGSAERIRGVDYDRLTAAIERDPQDATAYYRRGIILAQQREYELASRDFSEVIRLNPMVPDPFNNRCWVYLMLNRAELAIRDCDEALHLKPDFSDALDSRGIANLKLDRLDRAILDFSAALRLKPKLATSLYGRGLAYERKGNREAAEADMKAAIAANPGIREDFLSYQIR